MPEHNPPIDAPIYDDVEPPIAISHFVHTLRAYRPAIIAACVAVALLYTIVAGVIYLSVPAQRLMSLPFRLDFKGAAEGEYPDGLKFSTAEITSAPILLKVFQRNELQRFVKFNDFAPSVFIQETSPEYNRLVADYQARLADKALSPVDRDRIQREFDGKLKALAKNEMSINALRHGAMATVPESVLRKILSDILATWADDAVRQRHVLDYRLPMLRPSVLAPSSESPNPIISLLMLRTTTFRVLEMIAALRALPGADLVRTDRDHFSLEELRLRLDGIVRYRIETLVSEVNLEGPDRASALSFLQAQLAYDEQRVKTLQMKAAAVQEAVALYDGPRQAAERNPAEVLPATSRSAKTVPSGETVMPQLSDTFIEQLMALTNQNRELDYRKSFAELYKRSIDDITPAEEAVSYDRQLIDTVQRPHAGAASLTPAQATAQIATTRQEIGELVSLTNEIYQGISQRINPATELYVLTAPATTWTDRSVPLSRLAAYGFLLVLLTFLLAAFYALLHNRVREEEFDALQEHPTTA